MKVIVTGAAGFFGQNIVRRLLAEGYTVLGIDDLSVGTRAWLPPVSDRFAFVCRRIDTLSLKDRDLLGLHRFQGAAVIHLASKKIPRYGGRADTLTQNTNMTVTVANLSRILGARKFIFFSTSDVYGMQDRFSETDRCIIGQPYIGRWAYAVSKLWCEQYLHGMPADFNFTVLRIFGSYGPFHALNWTAGPQSVFISQALEKKELTLHGDGLQTRCFSYVDDIVDGVMAVLDGDFPRETFNLGNPAEEIRITDLACRIWRMIAPYDKPRLRYVSHTPLVYEDVPRRVPDISKATARLGFCPKTGLTEGLARTIVWQKNIMGF